MAANPKRVKRRAINRATAAEYGSTEAPKLAPRKPVAPIITFFLDRMKTKVDHKVVKVMSADGKTLDRFNSVAIVFIRDIRTKKEKVRGRFVEVEHFTQWRPFHNAMPVREQDNTSAGSQYVGIQAPMTAWIAAGLLDGMVLRDLPREPYQGDKKFAKLVKADQAEKKAA